MRYAGMVGRTALVLVAVITAVTLLAGPVHAQVVVTTTQTFVNPRSGNTVTVTTTLVDGDLSSQAYKEVTSTGLVVTERNITYWLDGDPNVNLMSHYEEYRMIAGYQNTTIRDYDQYGNPVEQYLKIVSNGVTIGEQYISYRYGDLDYDGIANDLVYEEKRTLDTISDGTLGWIVEIWEYDALLGKLELVSYREYPYDYLMLTERPGYGYGDENHRHSGPPGQAEGATGGANGNGSGGTSNPVEERPGYGHGDENHDHTRGRSQEFTK